MSPYDDDLPPGRKLMLQATKLSGDNSVDLSDALLAAIADELHRLNQQLFERDL